MRRLTTEEFIRRSKEKFGDKFDYLKTEYIDSKSKIIINCPEHDELRVRPSDHLNSITGCRLCGIYLLKDTKNDFISKAEAVHKNTYDYSKVNYKKSLIPVTIICRKHGDFKQPPSRHLQGHGCPKCAYIIRGNTQRLSNNEFISKARDIHGDTYKYSKVDYKSSYKRVTIICPTHGEFKQKPLDHLNGCGCQKCSSSKGERAVERFLIDNQIEFESQKKFNDCRIELPLPFDFYIPSKNMCIEFDGEQHYKGWWKNNPDKRRASLIKIRKRDAIKNNYCKEKSIQLLRIPYYEIDRIEEILSEELNV